MLTAYNVSKSSNNKKITHTSYAQEHISDTDILRLYVSANKRIYYVRGQATLNYECLLKGGTIHKHKGHNT